MSRYMYYDAEGRPREVASIEDAFARTMEEARRWRQQAQSAERQLADAKAVLPRTKAELLARIEELGRELGQAVDQRDRTHRALSRMVAAATPERLTSLGVVIDLLRMALETRKIDPARSTDIAQAEGLLSDLKTALGEA